LELEAPSWKLGCAGGIPGRGGTGSGGGVPGPLGMQHICHQLDVPFWQKKDAVRLIFTNYCQVSFHCSPHHSMRRKPNSRHYFFSDFVASFLNQVLHFVNHGAHKPSFCHLGHIQGKPHVRLFLLYSTSFLGHNS